MSAPQPARRIALEVIRAVRDSDAYANLLLPAKLRRAKLSPADSAFATELTYGTLRMQGYYDRVIVIAAGRPIEKIDPPILDIMRLACHQLLSMRVAQHAAVDEAVELAKIVGSRSAVGFVNGVLRTLTRSDPDQWRKRVIETTRSGEEALSAVTAHPGWVTRAFRQVLVSEGREKELESALEADNEAPRVGVVALPGLADRATLPGEITPYSPLGVILDHGDPMDLGDVRAGRARVQDEGSQLAALVLSRARPIESGERWLDMCAGPGGKSAVLAAEARIGSAVLIANEVIPGRAELVRDALRVFEPTPEVWVSDGRSMGEEHPKEFDRILLDAPCTGLGALRRRPEARWRKTPGDVAALSELQLALVMSALDALKPGGLLAYVTCSPHAAETKAIMSSALRRRPDVSRVDTPPVLQSIVSRALDLPPAPHVQLWPHRHGTDGMFLQLLTSHPATER